MVFGRCDVCNIAAWYIESLIASLLQRGVPQHWAYRAPAVRFELDRIGRHPSEPLDGQALLQPSCLWFASRCDAAGVADVPNPVLAFAAGVLVRLVRAVSLAALALRAPIHRHTIAQFSLRLLRDATCCTVLCGLPF